MYNKEIKDNSWRLLLSGRNDGATNMAIDEALWQAFTEQLNAGNNSSPILRFYGWQPACLSLGYAQRAEREVNFEACQHLGVDWVRRPTGGRAILHDYGELTYSLVASNSDSSFGNSILSAYYEISEALLSGLQALGVAASIAPKVSAHEASGKTAACFDAPSSYEITFSGRKIIGSAQARNNTTFLQQGTILLSVDVPKLFEVLQPPLRQTKAEAIEQVSQRLTSIEQARSREISFEEAQNAFIAAFAEKFQVELQQNVLTQCERELVAELRVAKYANPAWNMERQKPRPALR